MCPKVQGKYMLVLKSCTKVEDVQSSAGQADIRGVARGPASLPRSAPGISYPASSASERSGLPVPRRRRAYRCLRRAAGARALPMDTPFPLLRVLTGFLGEPGP